MGFSGLIIDVSLADLLQTISLGKKTGTLTLITEHGQFHIFLRGGYIVDAHAVRFRAGRGGERRESRAVEEGLAPDRQEVRLREMAAKMLRIPDGNFLFLPAETGTTSPVAVDPYSILLDAFKEHDENTRDGVATESFADSDSWEADAHEVAEGDPEAASARNGA